MRNKAFTTKAIHTGNEPNFKDGGSGDVVVPIHLSTTFARENVHKPTAGWEYSRSGNPTRTALEKNLAALENGSYGFVYASGLAAITNILMLLSSGDHILSIDDVYGGTRRLYTQVFNKFGLHVTYADFSTGEQVKKFLQKNTKMIWIESPTNPLLKIVDIESVARMANEQGIICVVDNTFASPYFQKPLDLGASIVMHSLTKYIGGHSDVVGGAIVVREKNIAERLSFLQNAVGAILSPFDCYSVLRGVKTLPLRMQQVEENAAAIVSFLQQQKKIKKIYYPGLETHAGYTIAKKQMSGFGGIISFEIQGTKENAIMFLESLRLFSIAESLGAVESLIEHPASMTHVSIPQKERERIGLSDTLIRMSVGIEDKDDLIADLSQAFDKI